MSRISIRPGAERRQPDAVPFDRRTAAGVGLGLVSALSFAGIVLTAKLAFEVGVSVAAAMTVRAVFGCGVLWLAAHLLRVIRGVPQRAVVRLLWIGATLYMLQGFLILEAVNRLPAAVASLLNFTYPAMVALLSVRLGRERLRWNKLLGLVLSFAGVVLVLNFPPTGGLDPVGVGVSLASALAFALYVHAVDWAARDVHPLAATTFILAGAIVPFAALTATTGRAAFGGEAVGWAWLAVNSLLLMPLGLVCYVAALRRIGPTRTSIADSFQLVGILALAAMFLAEPVTITKLLGILLVVCAIVLITVSFGPPKAGPVPAQTPRLGPVPARSQRPSVDEPRAPT